MALERWYTRHAWIWFAAMSAIGLVAGVLVVLDPSSAPRMFARFGHELPAAVVADTAATDYLEFVAHWSATATIGFNLFGLLIATTAFRRGQRWAWFASWYWPVLFSLHFLTYEGGFRYAQLAWVITSIAVLAVTSQRIRARTPAAADVGAADAEAEVA